MNKKLSIGLFNECFPPIQDGVSNVVENYADILYQKGHDVAVVTAKVPKHNYQHPYPILGFPSLPMIFRPPYRIGLPVWTIPPSHSLFKKPFDIIHGHSPFTAGNIGLKLKERKGTPFIMTFHSKFRQDFETVVKSKFVVDKMIKEIIKVYNGADEVWIPQLSVLDVLREYGYKGKVEVVPNGIDFDIADSDISKRRAEVRTELHVKDNEFVLLFVGQLIWEKNIKLILEGLRELKGTPFKMFFIGEGYAKNDIINTAKEFGIESNINMVGVLHDREDIKKYYTAADLFCFPSLYDNSPLVVREAAAHHLPSMMIHGSTAAANVIQDLHNGYLIENNSISFSKKIEEIKTSGIDRHQKIRINASETIPQRWVDILPEVEDRYRQLIARKKK